MRRGLVMLLLVGLAGMLLAGCSGEPAKPGEPGKTKASAEKALKLAVIPKGTMHVFWKSVHAGAVTAEKELPNVSIFWQGPVVEDDRRAQIELVENFIQKHVDGIVLAPLDDKALIAPVRAAGQAGIPVVIFDSDLADADAYISFVATDNYQGGVMAAQRLAAILGERGRVILVRYQVGSASNENREKGFLDEIARHAGLQVISSDQHAGPTVETAMATAETILTKFGQGQVDGIFCPNEPVCTGMLRALATAGRAGKVKFVGFDASDRLLEAMKRGEINALVVQDPVRIGYEAVKAAVEHLRGQKVEKRIDTGVTLVTPENLADPAIDHLVHPAVE